ncbi:MAG TPA: response regulator [Flavipsychrobacter sp.]
MNGTALRVLIADDDSEDLELMESSMLSTGHNVELSLLPGGESILRHLEDQPDHKLPMLMIIDYNMPVINGAEVVLKLNSNVRYRPIPKFILSTSNSEHHIRECMNNGADGYFVKPDTKPDLDKLAIKLLSYCRSNF